MTGSLLLLRVHLRRDWWIVLCWVVGGAILYWSQAFSVQRTYTQAELDRAAEVMGSNPAFVAMAGPARALDTIGGQVTWQATAFGAVLAGLMSMFLVGRHSRREEETGRDELVRAGVLGRQAPVAAALLTALVANLVLGLAVFASLVPVPLAWPDSLGLGLGLTAVGWAFSGAALVAAQLTSSSRSMYGLTLAVIAAAYVLRAVGDLSQPALRWVAPIGVYQAMHPFSGLRWWPALLLVAAAGALAVLAFALLGRRDIGTGLVAARPGPATGGRLMSSGLGLAWRLHRGVLLGWAVGLFLTGLTYGSIGDDVKDLMGDSGNDMFIPEGADLVQGYYATASLMLALFATAYAVASARRPATEEDAGLTEVLLAAGLSRRAWLLGHVAVTVGGTVGVLLAAGLGQGIGFALVTGDRGALWDLCWPVLTYAAPVLVVSGFARLLYGTAPRLLGGAWLLLLLAVLVMLFGEVLRLPQWLQDLSPFEHLALVPAQSLDLAAVVLVGLVAVALSTAGQVAFARRDLHT